MIKVARVTPRRVTRVPAREVAVPLRWFYTGTIVIAWTIRR